MLLRAFLVGVTGIEPAPSWSQTKRLTIRQHPDTHIQFWSKLWSAFFFHVQLTRKREKKRENQRKHNLPQRLRHSGDLLPNQVRYQLRYIPIAVLLYTILSVLSSPVQRKSVRGIPVNFEDGLDMAGRMC